MAIKSLPLDLIDDFQIQTSAELSVYSSTADKKYSELMKYWNVTSYSQRQLLHACPRKYQLAMHRALNPIVAIDAVHIDFTFGHAVGAGVQSYLLSKDMTVATINAMMSWRAPFTERHDRKKKSLWEAIVAVEQFAAWWEDTLGQEWELAYLPNGKPAIELAFSLHAQNGFKDYGHIDIVVKNKYTGIYAVLELKTTAAGADEAMYANSDQATGYAIMISSIWPEITEYTVHYCVFETSKSKWHYMPFDKTISSRAEWIKSLLLDHSSLETYERIKFYPKRGESCFAFRSRCQYFGECNMVPDDELPTLPADEEAEEVDAVIDLNVIINELRKE